MKARSRMNIRNSYVRSFYEKLHVSHREPKTYVKVLSYVFNALEMVEGFFHLLGTRTSRRFDDCRSIQMPFIVT